MRVAFTLRVRPDMLDAYVERHSPVWPEMVEELVASGRRNYSIFLDRPTATLFGYYETEDDDAARAYLECSDVAGRWEASMSEFFLDLDGRADQAAPPLAEVFHLHDQLTESRSA